MTLIDHAVVVGVFHDRAAARAAVDELRKAGFPEDQIGVAAREGSSVAETHTAAAGSRWEEGTAAGVATGAGVGALWALGIAAHVLPALGPVILGGLLASVAASAIGGAAVGGVVGALVGLGVPEEEARYYESQFHAGRTLVTVRAPGRYEEASAILRRHGGIDADPAAVAEGRRQ
jgi:heat induced stress protein YflT